MPRKRGESEAQRKERERKERERKSRKLLGSGLVGRAADALTARRKRLEDI